MKKTFYKLFAWVYTLPILLLPTATYAQLSKARDDLSTIGQKSTLAGGEGGDLTSLIGNLIKALLGVLGVIFVILIIYAGFLYMTAGGEEDKVKKSKSLMVQSVIGMIIIVAAYAIADYVIRALLTATGGG